MPLLTTVGPLGSVSSRSGVGAVTGLPSIVSAAVGISVATPFCSTTDPPFAGFWILFSPSLSHCSPTSVSQPLSLFSEPSRC